MTNINLRCKTCGYTARRPLAATPGSRGVHETEPETALCPKGHGKLSRVDGIVVYYPPPAWGVHTRNRA